MLELHHSFTLAGARGAAMVARVPVAALKSGSAWANGIRIFTESGASYSFPLTCTQYNANAARGDYKAVYQAILEKTALVGERIVGCSILSDEEAGYAEIRPYEKAEEELSITVTVCLETEFSACVPIPSDDNPLICALLGFVPLDTNAYALWGIDKTAPDSAMTSTLNATQNRVPAALKFLPDGISVTCELPASACDAVIFLNEKPAFRISAHSFYGNAFVLKQAVTGERTIGCTYPVNTCAQASAEQRQYLGVQILHVAKQLVPHNGILLNFDRSLKLISDPSYCSAAFVSDKEAFLIGERHGRLRALASLPCAGKSVHMTAENELVLIGETDYTVYIYVNGEGLVRKGGGSLPAIGAVETAVSKRNGKYTFLRKAASGKIERGYSDGNGYEFFADYAGGDGALIFRNRYCLCYITFEGAYAFDGNQTDTHSAEVIEELIRSFGPQFVSGYDGLLHVKKDDIAAFNYIYTIGGETGFLIPKGAKVKLCGDFALIDRENGVRTLHYYYRDTVQLLPVAVPDADTIAEVARVGNAVLIRRDNGALEEYGIAYDRSYLFHPLFEPGLTTTCVITGVRSIPDKARRVTVEIN